MVAILRKMNSTSFYFVIIVVVVCELLTKARSRNSYHRDQLNQVNSNSDPDVIRSIKFGMNLAMEHCQNEFKWDRWNCPREEFERNTGRVANRESAFIKAIVAAGVVHAITKNCSKGELGDCRCNPDYPSTTIKQKLYEKYLQPNETNALVGRRMSEKSVNWSWGGCSDDVTFGARVARELFEETYSNLTVISYIERHNYRLGTEIVKQTMVKKCRCHGVSGSCSLQTCWMQQAHFEDVARKLKERYTRARRLTHESVSAAIAQSNSIKRRNKVKLSKDSSVMLFLEESPDYCTANATKGWQGTIGRICSKGREQGSSRSEKKSCKTLCRQCGYKVRKEKKVVKKRCNCSFEWCCSVKCDMCSEEVEEYFCH